MLHLEFPEKRHEKMWREIAAEFETNGEEMVPYALTLALNDYDEYLAKTNDFHNNINVPGEYVQASTYFLLDEEGEKILGAVNIRHRLNEYLFNRGGNIGYGVAPSERRKGYATKMLALALGKCRELGLDKVLISCDKSNTASAKTITNNGGVLENEVTEDDGNVFQRYWINLLRPEDMLKATAFISLLRGINVGGNKKICMSALAKAYDELGFKDIRTYIQSGNVIFKSNMENVSELAGIIEEKIKNTFGFEVRVIVRTKEEFWQIIENNPFKNDDLSKLNVAFLSDTPQAGSAAGIDKVKDASEKYFINGKEIYIYYHNGVARSKISNGFFEKNLKVIATTRNWNTVNKLYELAK